MRRFSVLVVAAVIVATTAQPAAAADRVDTKRLRDAVTVDGILAHERMLQQIADQNGGNRAAGTAGLTATADYVKKTMQAAGYPMKEQPYAIPFHHELAPPELAQLTPTPTRYQPATFEFSVSGDVTGTVVPTNDIVVPPTADPSSTSGCEAGDFTPASATVAQVALIQRGGCFFQHKVENAEAAGYDAVIVFNEGQPGRDTLFVGSLAAQSHVPVVGVSFADGAALYAAVQTGAVTVHVVTSTEIAHLLTWNLITETKGGDPNKVLLVGTQMDSVLDGPGMNDNGSGLAAVLEIAEQISALHLKPRQKIRFVFFGAEEMTTFRTDGRSIGLVASDHYVASLSDMELRKIYANLNFDMVASPNYVRFVFDGDGSDTAAAGPPGSGQIERIFNDYFAGQGLATDPIEPITWDGGSDYGPIISAGIPTGGVFGGDARIKTTEQAAVYGGTAGEPYDACYHQACDTINNLNLKALDELGDAMAHTIWTLAKAKNALCPQGGRSARSKPAGAAAAAPRAHMPGARGKVLQY